MLLLFHGTDEYTARQAMLALVHDPRFDMNVDRFDGSQGELDTIRSACETMPFLSEGRLVVVDGLPKPRRGAKAAVDEETPAPAGKGKKGSKKSSASAQARDFAAALAEVGSTLPPTTTLLVIVAEELPKTHPLITAAAKQGEVRYFTPPTGAALDKWMNEMARREGVQIAPEASHQLAAFAASDLRRIALEINKLATYVGQGRTIDLKTVETLVADSREARIFELTDLLAQGERAKALSMLHELLDEGQQPLALIGLVARQIRILLQVRDLAGRGKKGGEIAGIVGMAPFLVDKTIAQARKFTIAQLEAAQLACLEVDRTLKSSAYSPILALDLLVTEFGRRA